jgi:phage terminase large subunit-like protein
LSLDGWRAGQSVWSDEEMRGEPCWGGVDLSSKIDLTAFVLVFPPTKTRVKWRVRLWAFTPAGSLRDRSIRDRAPFNIWADQGHLILSPDTRIDYDQVLECIQTQKQRFAIQAIGFDPHNAENLQKDLKARVKFGENQVVEVTQGYALMSQASKGLEADVMGGLVDSGSNPLMEWCVSNAVVLRDDKDNIFPTKKRSRGRIDPVTATVIARAVHQRLGMVPQKRAGAFLI